VADAVLNRALKTHLERLMALSTAIVLMQMELHMSTTRTCLMKGGLHYLREVSKLEQTQEKEQQIELQIFKIGVLVDFLKDLDRASYSSARFSWHHTYQADRCQQQHAMGYRE
jgi:hypothetical protein